MFILFTLKKPDQVIENIFDDLASLTKKYIFLAVRSIAN